jgi:hypothetical protein
VSITPHRFISLTTHTSTSDREVKDEREDGRENGTNGEDRKGEFEIPTRMKNNIH